MRARPHRLQLARTAVSPRGRRHADREPARPRVRSTGPPLAQRELNAARCSRGSGRGPRPARSERTARPRAVPLRATRRCLPGARARRATALRRGAPAARRELRPARARRRHPQRGRTARRALPLLCRHLPSRGAARTELAHRRRRRPRALTLAVRRRRPRSLQLRSARSPQPARAWRTSGRGGGRRDSRGRIATARDRATAR